MCAGGFPPPRQLQEHLGSMSSRSSSGGCHLWVQSGSCLFPAAAWCVPAGATWLRRGPLLFSPPLRWKVFLTSSLPTARHAGLSFASGVQEGKKKDSSLPQKPSTFPSAQASPLRLGRASASKGGLNLPCRQLAADPGLSGGPRPLQNWQPPGVTSPAHTCSGTPSAAVALLAQRTLLAKRLQPGILAYLWMVLKENTGNVAHLLGNFSRTLRERH